MKREVIICLLLVLLIGFICAEEVVSQESNTDTNLGQDFQSYSNNLLSKQIIIPDYLQNPTRIIFGISDSNIDLQSFIILFSVWLFLIFIIQAILEIVPLFGEGFKSWLGAIVITLLISITGAINPVANWLFGFGGIISLIKKWDLLKIIFVVIILGIITVGLKKLLQIIEHEKRMGENYMMGTVIKKQEQMSKMRTGI
jgi:hypothetical protein